MLVPHNRIPQGLINATSDEHSVETMAFRAIIVPNSRGSLLHASLFYSKCTCWGVHTLLGPLCSEARLARDVLFAKAGLTTYTPPFMFLLNPLHGFNREADMWLLSLLDEEMQALEVWFARGQMSE